MKIIPNETENTKEKQQKASWNHNKNAFINMKYDVRQGDVLSVSLLKAHKNNFPILRGLSPGITPGMSWEELEGAGRETAIPSSPS